MQAEQAIVMTRTASQQPSETDPSICPMLVVVKEDKIAIHPSKKIKGLKRLAALQADEQRDSRHSCSWPWRRHSPAL